MKRTLMAMNPRKAADPDGISRRVQKDYADQLGGIFTRIFNRSLYLSVIPPCLKSSTIVPLLKRPSIASLNNYRPVALTPVVSSKGTMLGSSLWTTAQCSTPSSLVCKLLDLGLPTSTCLWMKETTTCS